MKAPREIWQPLAVAALVLLAIEVALASWQFTAATVRARLALALRLAMAALLVLALLGAGIPQTVDRQATVFVADVSASVADAQPDRTSRGVVAPGLVTGTPEKRLATLSARLTVVRRRE